MIENITAKSSLIDETLKQELSGIFAKLKDNVTLKAVLDPDTEKGAELAGFLAVIETLSPKLFLEIYSMEEEETASELDTTYLPVTGLYKGRSLQRNSFSWRTGRARDQFFCNCDL